MGRIIKPGEIKQQANTMKSALANDSKALSDIYPAINSFTSNTELTSVAWTRAKGQLRGHQAVIKGMICGNDTMSDDCTSLADGVGSEDLIEDEIRQKIETQETNIKSKTQSIESYSRNIRTYQRLAVSMPLSELFLGRCIAIAQIGIAWCERSINASNEIIANLREKIEKITTIDIGTSELYSDAYKMYALVAKGIGSIKASWTGKGYKALETGWMSEIETEWNDKLQKDVFDANGKLRQEFVEEISNKSTGDMTLSEQEKFGLMVNRLLSDDLTTKEMNIVIGAYYEQVVVDDLIAPVYIPKKTTTELILSMDIQCAWGTQHEVISREVMQQGKALQAALSVPGYTEGPGTMTYSNGVFEYNYTEIRGYSTGESYKLPRIATTEIAVWQADGVEKADKEGDELMGNIYGYSISEGIANAGINQVVSSGIEAMMKGIPGASFVSAGVGVAIDVEGKNETAKRATEISEIDNCGPALLHLNLYYVSTVDKPVNDKVNKEEQYHTNKVYPSADTEKLITKINEKLLDDKNQIMLDEPLKDTQATADKLRTANDLAIDVNDIKNELVEEAIENRKEGTK